MRNITLLAAAVAVALGCFATPVRAQRRDGGARTPVLEVSLPTAVQFGTSSVAARRYRLTLGEQGFALADPQTMILVVTVPVTQSAATTTIEGPQVKVTESGNEVRIVLQHEDRLYTAVGQKVALSRDTSLVKFAGKQETALVGGIPEPQSEQALIEGALERYERSLAGCADRAHRARWTTDHPQFFKCVCPQTEKWRLPKPKQELRVHRPLAKGKSGYSLSVTPAGKVTKCRVWAGASPPPEPNEAAAAPTAAPTAAPAVPAVQPTATEGKSAP